MTSQNQRARDTAVVTPVYMAIVAVLTAVALVLRAMDAAGPLSIDEVWSLYLIAFLPSQSEGIIGAFALLMHDNSHPLNTAWLWLVGLVSGGAPRDLSMARPVRSWPEH
ncbi:MAG: hypothetical protein GDA49_11630 [Rhodospirillales bacterium]|nr:hypothetical protein [Rhodospirillales bacterium]